MTPTAYLESYAKPQSNLPRAIELPRDLTEDRTADVGNRASEKHRVRHIKCFGLKLGLGPLPDAKRLNQ